MSGCTELVRDVTLMEVAVKAAEVVRGTTAPNPWVGSVLLTSANRTYVGATETPNATGSPDGGGRHAEIVALDAARAAGDDPAGGTLFTTLEPCSHMGRTPPCTDAIVDAQVARVVVGMIDPDPIVAGAGVASLRLAGVQTDCGIGADLVASQLEAYVHHRRTGRPWVVLKLAATADGRTAAPDGTSRWITGETARADTHRLRARCDSVLVGAGTARSDDPALTVRHAEAVHAQRFALGHQPRRFVLGAAPPKAKMRPCEEVSGRLDDVLDDLGARGVVELLVEGGAHVAAAFHRAGLVNEYVLYVAAALMGGGTPLLGDLAQRDTERGGTERGGTEGEGAATQSPPARSPDVSPDVNPPATSIEQLWRGTLVDVAKLGNDVRLVFRPPGGSARGHAAQR